MAQFENRQQKVLHEYLVCEFMGKGAGARRCRRRGYFYIDGYAYCEEHIHAIAPFLLEFARPIRYDVAR